MKLRRLIATATFVVGVLMADPASASTACNVTTTGVASILVTGCDTTTGSLQVPVIPTAEGTGNFAYGFNADETTGFGFWLLPNDAGTGQDLYGGWWTPEADSTSAPIAFDPTVTHSLSWNMRAGTFTLDGISHSLSAPYSGPELGSLIAGRMASGNDDDYYVMPTSSWSGGAALASSSTSGADWLSDVIARMHSYEQAFFAAVLGFSAIGLGIVILPRIIRLLARRVAG